MDSNNTERNFNGTGKILSLLTAVTDQGKKISATEKMIKKMPFSDGILLGGVTGLGYFAAYLSDVSYKGAPLTLCGCQFEHRHFGCRFDCFCHSGTGHVFAAALCDALRQICFAGDSPLLHRFVTRAEAGLSIQAIALGNFFLFPCICSAYGTPVVICHETKLAADRIGTGDDCHFRLQGERLHYRLQPDGIPGDTRLLTVCGGGYIQGWICNDAGRSEEACDFARSAFCRPGRANQRFVAIEGDQNGTVDGGGKERLSPGKS